jgi:hypothetical protein
MEYRSCGIGKEKGVEGFKPTPEEKGQRVEVSSKEKGENIRLVQQVKLDMTIEEIAISSHITLVDALMNLETLVGFRGEQGFGPVLLALRAASMSSCGAVRRGLADFYSYLAMLTK